MKKQLSIILTGFLLSGCLSPYEYKDCGVLYDKPPANPLGTNGNLIPDTWGDVMVMTSRSANQDHFFRNNACMLTGEQVRAPK